MHALQIDAAGPLTGGKSLQGVALMGASKWCFKCFDGHISFSRM